MTQSSIRSFPNKEELKESYELYRPVLSAILFSIEQKLKKNLTLPSKPTFKARVKDFNSYYRKLLRVRPPALGEENFPTLTDLLGIRVICAFLEDLTSIEKQIVEIFEIKEIERKGADRTFREFGYESIHILVDIPEEFRSEKVDVPKNLVCEIQIRTILQDAWAEVEHELVYKSEFSPFDLPLRRKLASMNASLSLADIVFQEIRDYQNKLNRELDYRRGAFYEQADKLSRTSVDFKSAEKPAANLEAVSPYVHGTIDDMILEAIHAHNTGDLGKAVQIYTQIINAEPAPNSVVLSVIYKHRGMAYFAQNNFESALHDYIKSTEYDPSNFRSFYYVGIVLSVLNDHREALKYFNKSLEINEYQSHVYYRKALSNYHLGDYAASMSELTRASQLGLSDDDYIKLKETLVSKLGMGMN